MGDKGEKMADIIYGQPLVCVLTIFKLCSEYIRSRCSDMEFWFYCRVPQLATITARPRLK